MPWTFGIAGRKAEAFLCVVLWMASRSPPAAAVQGDADRFQPKSIGGILCHYYQPWDYLKRLKALTVDRGYSLNRRGSELQRSLKRRFADRLHLPFPKGVVLVSTPNGFEFWYCEEADDKNAARQLIDSFAAQWRSERQSQRPSYRVELDEVQANAWKLSIFDVVWTQKFAKVQKTKNAPRDTVWQKSERLSRTAWFRYDGQWLWSSYSASLMRAEVFSELVAEPVGARSDDEAIQLYANAWLRPANIPEVIRRNAVVSLKSLLATQRQQRDTEAAERSRRRRILKTLQESLLVALFNDVKTADLFVWDSAEGISVQGTIQVQADSKSSRALAAMVPRRNMGAPPANDTDLSLMVSARLPDRLVAVWDESAVQRRPAKAPGGGFDVFVFAAGDLKTLATMKLDALIRCQQMQRLLQYVSVVLPDFPGRGLLEDARFSASVAADPPNNHITVRVLGSERLPRTDAPVLQWNDLRSNGSRPTMGRFALRLSGHAIRSLGSPWLLPKSAGAKFSGAESGREISSERLSLNASVDPRGIRLDVFCSAALTTEILAAAVLDRTSRPND